MWMNGSLEFGFNPTKRLIVKVVSVNSFVNSDQ